MIRARRRWGAWLTATIALSAAAFWGTGPAHATADDSTGQAAQIGGGKPWVIHDQAAYDQALKSSDWVRTPSGLAYKTCVYSAPDGASVANGYIVSPSGAKQQIKPCTHPTLADPIARTNTSGPGLAQAAALSGACSGDNPAYWAYSCWQGSRPLTYLSEKYAVPTNPRQNGALVYLWGGLSDAADTSLLQNVLSWGANTVSNTVPNYIWYITPWYIYSGGRYVHGSNVHVNPGDTIDSYLSAYNCDSAGDCAWSMQVSDENTGGVANYTVGSGVPFTVVLGGVMEVPRASGCIETPASGHAAFRNLAAVDIFGNAVTPSFGVGYIGPECSVHETASATAADILWTP